MDTIIEQQRRAHEEIERLEQTIVREFASKPKNHKERVAQELFIRKLVDRVSEKSLYLSKLYKDEDKLRQSEIESLSGPDEFSEFYTRLKSIKDYHRRYPNEAVENMEMEFLRMDRSSEEEALESMYSGEEAFGRYLDLHTLFTTYLNLKGVDRMDYLSYLSKFDHLYEIPRKHKNSEYRKYVEELSSYLEGFLKRVNPLTNVDDVLLTTDKEFQEKWEKGIFPGWEKERDVQEDNSNGHSNSNGIYCAACQKYFAKETVFDAHLKGKKHLKAAEEHSKRTISSAMDIQPLGSNTAPSAGNNKVETKQQEIARLEARIMKLAEVLGQQRDDTKGHVELKQSQNPEERFADDDEVDEVVSNADDSDEEEKIYNPLRLPLGWDGKPIPYWLYKLHGLGVEYPCEICGGYVYMGRRAFERHFQEWRHAHGMRCLGIPNSRHFAEITSIEDAQALWAKLKVSQKVEHFKPDTMEEFEDNDGNVFNRRMYEDLKNQGLL